MGNEERQQSVGKSLADDTSPSGRSRDKRPGQVSRKNGRKKSGGNVPIDFGSVIFKKIHKNI